MRKTMFLAALFVCMKAFSLPSDSIDQKVDEEPSQPVILQKVFEKTKKNKNWKASVPSDSIDQKVDEDQSEPVILQKIFERTKKNKNWKASVKTGAHEQIVYMDISTSTTPDNEIGKSTSSFDQVILIATGAARVSLNGKTSSVKNGDMIFIPKGTVYNISNKSRVSKLKLASFCSNVSSPEDIVYKNKIDERR